MPDRTQHPLSGHQRHGLNDINDGFADTLDGITKGLADVLGDLGQGLIDFLNRLTADKEQQPNNAEKKDAYAKVKSWEWLAANEDKSTVLGEAADFIKGKIEPGEKGVERGNERQTQQAEVVRERSIEIPQEITALPEYEVMRAAQRLALDEQQHRPEAQQDPATPGVEEHDSDAYLRAVHQLGAKVLGQGQEIEAEVVEIANVGEENYYVLEQNGERLAVPAGAEPAHEVGDEIIATRTREGFETEGTYGYGR